MKPNLFNILMYPTVDLREKMILDHLLRTFECKEHFIPTIWGNSETTRAIYNRDEIIQKATYDMPQIAEVHLRRDKMTKYSGYFDLHANLRSFLNFSFDKSMNRKYWGDFFELADQIAEIVKPRYGVTHISWRAVTPWHTEKERIHKWMNLSSYPVPVKFLPNGPLGLGMRTFLSGDILEMFGKNVIINTPAYIKELSWGGIRIDLVDDPWESDLEHLLERWLEVMEYLNKAEVIAVPNFEDNMGVTFNPNSKWKEYLRK
ncbi:hypothetical protein [Paenibacillus sp. Root52]|uniref:hypothetical protein n=1 Tax=Paenibacillus sp. Root52 TaxID=1736552 RepID=UPI000A3E1FA1|nr:hypothetical protein [Paenibacillus sp. Root52]